MDISEIHDKREIPNLRAGFYPICSSAIGDGMLLPYHSLGRFGLERLCYLLLLSEGHVPRYFGKPGQEQYGIDLLVTHGDQCMVYQCKNVKDLPLHKMKEALELFESEWLGREELPRPNQFVLCCPLPLQELKANSTWTELEPQFYKRTGVIVKFWDRNYLDARLRKLPDVVEELFSDKAVEQFCGLDNWKADLFWPVVEDSGIREMERYLSLKKTGQIYIDPDLAEKFTEKIETNGEILIKGLPGTGKSITSLALAGSLQQSRYRVFYLSMRHDIDENILVEGIQWRLSRPTIFLLDDCQGKFERLYWARQRVLRKLRNSGSLLIFIKRTAITPKGMPRGDYSDLEQILEDQQAVLEIQPTLMPFRQIIALRKPQFAGLSEERFKRVFEFTGRDLMLLDQLIDTINSPDEIDQLSPETLFRQTMIRYFGAPTVYCPGFRNLAALAQFDLAPPASAFRFNPHDENKGAAAELVVMADSPPRYIFLHSSAAELIFRSLAWNDRVSDYIGLAADYLIEFFKSCSARDGKLAEDLSNAVWNRLRLEDDEREEKRLKSLFLADDSIHSLIRDSFEELAPNLLALYLLILKDIDEAAFAVYYDLVKRKVEDGTVLDMVIKRPFWESSFFLIGLKRHYPDLRSAMSEQTLSQGISPLIETAELQNTLLLIANLSEPDDPRWIEQLALVPDSQIENMIQRTIASGRSIGTIHLALGELRNTDERLLAKLEGKIGARRYLCLVNSVGTIFELFSIIRYSSLGTAEELIDSVDPETMDALADKTIASGRSIGTINLALRELKNADERLLVKLEAKIGATRYLRLISSVGTIYELFKIIEHSSLDMAEELIDSLDPETIDTLADKTIASGRSIGTLNFTLRELKNADERLLAKLEDKIGARRYLWLISSVGTIYELLMIIRDSSLGMAEDLIDSLDPETVDTLVDKTIASGRSIGTLGFALRELKNADERLLAKLEDKIGARRYLQLITSIGTISELFRIIEHSSLDMAEKLIDSLDSETMDALVDKTIASGRSVGTINMALRELKNADERLLAKLEGKIGVGRYLRLVTNVGTTPDLFRIIEHSSLDMAEELIDSLDSEIMDALVDKTIASGWSIGTIHLALWELKKTNLLLLGKLERRMGTERWWRLICANGNLAILARVLNYVSLAFRKELAQSSRELSIGDWEGLLLRGDFADLCLFVRWRSQFFSRQFTKHSISQLDTAFQTLIKTGSWQVLNQGAGLLAESSESPIKKHISKLLYEHVYSVDPSQLKFDSFSEAACCIHLLWELVPSSRKKLADSLMSILPEQKDWYADEGFLRSSRSLFFMLAASSSHSAFSVLVNPEIRQEDAERALGAGNTKEVAAFFDKSTTLDAFLYIWNFYALWFEWRSSGSMTFADFLHLEIRSALNDILAERLWNADDQEETDNLIALAGLLSFLRLPFDPIERPDTESVSFERYLTHARTMTSIPAVFFLLGLESIFDREHGVARETWRRVLSKAGKYSEETAALEHLKDFVRTRVRR